MWRAHFVVLGEEPSESALSRVVDGYQLWRESRSGLHFLTAHSDPLGKRPDFGNFLERSISDRLDTGFIDAFVAEQKGVLDILKVELNSDLIHQTASLSKQLGMGVLVAEDTDDEYGQAVMVKDGALQYLRFRTTRDIGDDYDVNAEDPGVEVVYRPDTAFVVEPDRTSDMFGIAQTAIDEVYGVPGLNLVNFADVKPTREEAKRRATGAGTSISALLDSYGVFKRISHAPPKLSLTDKLLIPLRFVTSALIVPPLFVGVTAYAMFFSYRGDKDPPMGRIMLLGAAILALPIMLLVWIIRALL